MLINFAVTNYRGFARRVSWDLSHPNNYAFNTFAIKGGHIKNGIIYGPNGCGKSNLGLAVFDIANHLSHKWKKPDYYLNFASASSKDDPVEFEYTFDFGGRIVQYNYAKVVRELRGEIVTEQLIADGVELLYKDSKAIRLSDEFHLSSAAIESIRNSANNLSIVNYLLSSIPLPNGHVLLQLRDFVENMLFFRSLDNREFIGLKEGGSNIEEYIVNNNLSDDFARFLDEVSGQKYDFLPPTAGDKSLFCLMGDVRIPFQLVASTGTLNLELQYYWLKEMVNASFVFVDEFDAFYHFDLSYAICRRLFEGDRQVFVTTHNTFLLTNDLLRPDCYFIMKDNQIDQLCNLTPKELRFGHNLEKLYRGGTFD